MSYECSEEDARKREQALFISTFLLEDFLISFNTQASQHGLTRNPLIWLAKQKQNRAQITGGGPLNGRCSAISRFSVLSKRLPTRHLIMLPSQRLQEHPC